MDDFIITVGDARAYFGGCIPGWKVFAETYGFNWPNVVRHGLLASQLESTNDAMALALVEYVRNRRNIS